MEEQKAQPPQVPEKLGSPKVARQWIVRYEAEIGKMLNLRIEPELWLRAALTAVQQTPGLLECTTLSLLGGLFEMAQLGLVPGNVRGQAFLIPYKARAQLQVGYKGYVTLARRENALITAQVVCKGDEFEIEYGTQPKIRHKPNCEIDRTKKENIIGSYACIRYADGRNDFEYLSREAIEKRAKASPAGVKAGTPWGDWWEEMARKSAIRALGKRCALLDVQRAATLDEYGDVAGAPQQLEASAAAIMHLPEIPAEQLPSSAETELKRPKRKPKPIEQPAQPPKPSANTIESPQPGLIDQPQISHLLEVLYDGIADKQEGNRRWLHFRDLMASKGIGMTTEIPVADYDKMLAAARAIAKSEPSG